jgi:methylase of polypeptide subunit release factors
VNLINLAVTYLLCNYPQINFPPIFFLLLSFYNIKLVNKLELVLKSKGVKQTWLCEQLGKSYNTVNNYVKNRNQPSLIVLKEIAILLKVDIEDLIDFPIIGKPLKDELSEFHEKNVTHEIRKKLGQFYTHQELVQYIYSKIPISKESKILDPTVGAGAFLIGSNKVNPKNLFGIDIDSTALDLCKQNVVSNFNEIQESNFVCGNTLNYDLNEIFPEVSEAGGFDIIIGNPPFQNLKSKIDFNPSNPVFYPFINGVVNSCTLIIAQSLNYLKDDGYLGFVLPKNILRVDSFQAVRNQLSQNCTLIEIIDLGHYFYDVRGDQIVILLKKTKPKSYNNSVLIGIRKKGEELNNISSYLLKQEYLLNVSYFPIYRHQELLKVAEKLEKISMTLGERCEIFRGLNISSGNPLISKESHKKDEIIIYRGDSIKKFGIKYNLYLTDEESIKDKNKINRLKRKKVILQNLCSKEGGITATYSNEFELNIDTVTNVIPFEDSCLYILGLINSNFSNFYLLNIVFLSSNFSLHTDSHYLGKIPFVIPTKKLESKVIEITKQLMVLNGERNEQYITLYKELNSLIYKIYELSTSEIKIIENSLIETLSKKQYYGTTNE